MSTSFSFTSRSLTGSFWPRQGFLKKPGVIKVVVGPLIDSGGKRAKQVNLETEQWIEGTMKELEGKVSATSGY